MRMYFYCTVKELFNSFTCVIIIDLQFINLQFIDLQLIDLHSIDLQSIDLHFLICVSVI